MIELLVFDLGGVVVFNGMYPLKLGLSKAFGIGPTDFSNLLHQYDDGLTKGQITLLDFYTDISKRGLIESEPDVSLSIHMDMYRKFQTTDDPVMARLIEDYKKDYKVVCLTNTEVEVAALNEARGLFGRFHKAYVSTRMGKKKPDAEVYEAVFLDSGVLPKNTLLIDDIRSNVEGIKRSGAHGLLYRGYPAEICACISSNS